MHYFPLKETIILAPFFCLLPFIFFNDEKKEDLVAVNNVAREKNKANRLYDIFDLFLRL